MKYRDISFHVHILQNFNNFFINKHRANIHGVDSFYFVFFYVKCRSICSSSLPSTNRHVPHLTPMLEPRASNCSEIWNANSLVGVRTSVWSRCGEASSDWRMGRAKAPVLPEPVSARPMTSLPAGAEETNVSHWPKWSSKFPVTFYCGGGNIFV